MDILRIGGICLWLSCLLACPAPPEPDEGPETGTLTEPQLTRDWAEIQAEGVLRAITVYSATSYFLYRGQPMGFEYELLERFAKEQDLRLEMVIAEDMDAMFDMLNRGEGDLIAHGLTVTRPRKQYVAFTRHYFTTHQALVQRKPPNWRQMKLHEIEGLLVQDPLDLIGDTVHVRRRSSYFQRLCNLSEEMGGEIVIDTVPGTMPTEDIIREVAEGRYRYTVADYHLAAINATYFTDLHIETPMSSAQRIAWAVRKNSPQLKQTLDRWIEVQLQETDYHVIFNKYFKNKKAYRRIVRSDFFSKNSQQISEYDSLLRALAQPLGWDWRLLSAQVYQESQFDPEARSWAGAQGLLQLMPATARELGVTDPGDPVANLRGAIRYLQQLWNDWSEIPDSVERIKFTLASFNCGLGHVRDAQRLAAADKAPSDRWEEGVDDYILKLSDPRYHNETVVRYGYARGTEPYYYVQDIFELYAHYATFIPA
ncbi:MAG: lytic transglycosylase F [Bacteroidetes bacterium]|nr:MAG: lytic transglycosylase F [Bacteroidota bacterium]